MLLDKIKEFRLETKIDNNKNEIIGFVHKPTNIVADYLLSITKGQLSSSITLAPFEKKYEEGLLRYKVYKCLAVGGFSKVYLVRSYHDGKFYVMKVISKIPKQNEDPDLSVIYN